MLQQTTVAAVAPRFERFLAAFPDASPPSPPPTSRTCSRLWEGLGYYRRARHLHRAARTLVDRHGGQLPDDPAVWAELPGVGRYILGAVLSPGVRPPAADRRGEQPGASSAGCSAQAGDVALGPVQAWLWETAAAILPQKRVGDFNQALMELGALVCTPAAPRLPELPAEGRVPGPPRGPPGARSRAKPARPATVEVREVCVVARHGGRVLLARRPAGGRWANMWEFPRGRPGAGRDARRGRRAG